MQKTKQNTMTASAFAYYAKSLVKLRPGHSRTPSYAFGFLYVSRNSQRCIFDASSEKCCSNSNNNNNNNNAIKWNPSSQFIIS